jgi:hypothetical protein
MTGLVVALIVFTAAGGFGVWSERFLRGLAIAGIAMFLGGLVQVPPLVTLAVVVLWGAGVSPAWRARRRAAPRPGETPAPHNGSGILPLVVTLIPVVIVFAAALRLPLLDFDGRVFWLLKAKAIAQESAIDGPFFHGETTWNPRNRYPLLMPLDTAAVLKLSHSMDDHEIRGLYALTFLALLLVVRRRVGPWEAAIVAWIPQLLVNVEGGALTAYNDIPLAAFAACALFDVVDEAPPARIGIWLAAMTLTKSEGLLYAAVILACAAYVYRKKIWPAATQYAVAIAALMLWRSRIPATDEEDFLGRLPLLPHNLDRIVPAITGVVRHMFTFQQWGFFWIAVVIGAVIAIRRREWIPAATIAAMLGVYLAAYLVTEWQLGELIDRSADRLLAQLVGPAVLLIRESWRSR